VELSEGFVKNTSVLAGPVAMVKLVVTELVSPPEAAVSV
jgi:hypothetical protein